MSFQPLVPVAGFGGWKFLNRTMEAQQATFNKSPALQRDIEYFQKEIGKVKNADELVSDRRLLRVALGAFGLQDDLDNRFFIKKVLNEGTTEPKSLANRLADKRYLEFAKAFGFSDPVPSKANEFADRITEAYKTLKPEMVKENTTDFQKDMEFFRQEIGAIGSAAELVQRPRLLRIALTPFGLEDEAGKKSFLTQVMNSNTSDPKSLANQLTDKRYLELTKTFGFGEPVIATDRSSAFSDKIVAAYKARQFEEAVGNTDQNLRIGLATRRDLKELALKTSSEDTKWFGILGSAPLRKVFETTFGLPKSFGSLDLDLQLATMKQKAGRMFGENSVSQFSDTGKMETLVQKFLIRADLQSTSQQFSGGSAALQLLQSTRMGG